MSLIKRVNEKTFALVIISARNEGGIFAIECWRATFATDVIGAKGSSFFFLHDVSPFC
jgi:hypothetical protein